MTLSRKTAPLLGLAALVALGWAAARPVAAQQVYQVSFGGTFFDDTNDPANPVFDAAALVGSTFTASYLFDATAPNQTANSSTGEYGFGSMPYGLTFTVYDQAHNPLLTGTPGASTVSGAFTSLIGPTFYSRSLASGGSAAGLVDSLISSLTLSNPNGNYDNSLPISPGFYDISHFPFDTVVHGNLHQLATTFDVIGDDANGNEDDAIFKVNSLSLQPVPETSTTLSFGLLLALGMGGVLVAARRRKLGSNTRK